MSSDHEVPVGFRLPRAGWKLFASSRDTPLTALLEAPNEASFIASPRGSDRHPNSSFTRPKQRRRLRVRADFASRIPASPDELAAEETFSAALLGIMRHLRELRARNAPAETIQDLDQYVASAARHAWADYVRARSPRRRRLEARIRAVLDTSSDMALWTNHLREGSPASHSGKNRGGPRPRERVTRMEGFVEALKPAEGQCGAAFLIGGSWAGLDLFDCGETLSRTSGRSSRERWSDWSAAGRAGGHARTDNDLPDDAVEAALTAPRRQTERRSRRRCSRAMRRRSGWRGFWVRST